MKFIISSQTLLKHLQLISGVIAPNNALPILENFLFEINNENLILRSTDLDCTMETNIGIESNDTGTIAIDAKMLLEFLKAFPEQPLTFIVNNENNIVKVISEDGEYSFSFYDGNEFPKTPTLNNEKSITINSQVFLKSITQTIFAAGNDELRPVMSGVFCDVSSGNINFVATDAHKLIKHKVNEQTEEKTSFILPKKPLNIIKNIFSDYNEEIKINYDESNAIFTFNNITVYCRLIDGNYPNYEQVIPKDNPNTLNIFRSVLISAIKKVMPLSNKSTNQIVFDIKGNLLNVSSVDNDVNNSALSVIKSNLKYEGEDLKIAFNGKFLLEILQSLNHEELIIKLNTPARAVTIEPDDEMNNTIALIMPIMLTDE